MIVYFSEVYVESDVEIEQGQMSETSGTKSRTVRIRTSSYGRTEKGESFSALKFPRGRTDRLTAHGLNKT
jgi:hypothetical protein